MSACEIDPRRLEKRGMAWVMGAFVFCPCHLPITLSVLALLLGGTAAGTALRSHPYVAGAAITSLWAAGTWRGFLLVRAAQRFAYNPRGHGISQPVSRH
jgi:cytochrome c biogenesis protein CcdA